MGVSLFLVKTAKAPAGIEPALNASIARGLPNKNEDPQSWGMGEFIPTYALISFPMTNEQGKSRPVSGEWGMCVRQPRLDSSQPGDFSPLGRSQVRFGDRTEWPLDWPHP
jgi:hypothetical protein